jgi:lipoprotein-releasing system ATP-binding protein
MEIGFVFQSHHLLPEFSALENVMMPLLMRRLGKTESRLKASEMLGFMGLADRKSHRPGELSGGEQQRVALARALVGAPRLLLADEPTGNLDTATSHQVHTLIRRLHMELGLTSLIVTHDTGLARLCDEAWELKFGSLGPVSFRSASAESL